MLKISSYNVNGIRAAYKKGIMDFFEQSDPDVICLQEMRADETQIPDEIKELGYHQSYYIAEKKGYSGVAIFSKEEPLTVEQGIGVDWIDEEGRVIMNEFKDVRIFSVYAPSGTTGDIRQDMKYKFMDSFYEFAQTFIGDDKPTIFCGDFNICHTEIDIHNPKSNKNTSGFLIEEREWVTKFLEMGYVDTFRAVRPGEVDLYSWWSYRAGAKSKNKGWRIDYHLATSSLAEKAREAEIEMDWGMSDHAPVTIIYDI